MHMLEQVSGGLPYVATIEPVLVPAAKQKALLLVLSTRALGHCRHTAGTASPSPYNPGIGSPAQTSK